MASFGTVTTTTNAYSDSEFSEPDSSSFGLSRRTISELAKSVRAGVYRDVNTDSETTEESIKLLMQEQFERNKQLTLTAMNREFVKSINAYSLILVSLATVTYSGFLQPPGSFDDEGYIRTSENRSLTWFDYFNSLAFHFSAADLILCLSGNFALLADLHAETILSPEKPKKKLKQSSTTSFRVSNDLIDRITPAPDAPCPSMEKLAHNMVPDGVYFEQSITHTLAHFVADTSTKAATVNLLFVISLTCCVATFAAAGSAVTSGPHQSQVPIIVTPAVGCFTYLCFMAWLLTVSFKFC